MKFSVAIVIIAAAAFTGPANAAEVCCVLCIETYYFVDGSVVFCMPLYVALSSACYITVAP